MHDGDTVLSGLRLVDPAGIVANRERRLAAEHWLLSTTDARGRDRARKAWQIGEVALLPLGTLFSAVRLPADLILPLAGGRWNPPVVDAVLQEALEGGPVICDPRGRRWYALVSGSMPTTYSKAATEWRQTLGVDVLGRGTDLGVPPLNMDYFDERTYASYWSSPMDSAGDLCPAQTVLRLISAGVQRLGGES